MSSGISPLRVTVVLPTHNRRHLLQEAVASVLQQTLRAYDVVIIDDASEDDTWSWLSGLDEPRIRTIRFQDHRERAAARNVGLAVAEGEFILFLDDDDVLTAGALDSLSAALTLRPKAIAAVGARTVFDGVGHRKRVPHPRFLLVRDLWSEVLFGSWVGIPGQTLYRTAILREAGGWNTESIPAEDQDLWLRLARHGPVAMVPTVVLGNRIHDGQWRPENVGEIEERLRERHLLGLDGCRRRRALELLRARRGWGEGTSSYQNGNYLRAICSFGRALLAAPELLRSPVATPGLLFLVFKAVGGAVAGRSTMAILKRGLHGLRKISRRVPSARQPVRKRASA